MRNFNYTILEQCKKYISNTSNEVVYRNFYKDKERVDVLVRDDAEKYTTDWVRTMNNFVGKVCIALDPESDDLFGFNLVDVETKINDEYHVFTFDYESLIPIELYDSLSNPTYSPKKFIYESNTEFLNEAMVFDTNEFIKTQIQRRDIKPEPIIWIGDTFKIRKDALNYYENEEWLEENHIGYCQKTYNFVSHCIENDIELECIGKFKGASEPEYPWWSFVKNKYLSNNLNELYIPDLLIKDKKTTPTYTPKKFVYESKQLEYYNEITKEKTRYKYRYKTIEEFEKEFSKPDDYPEEWRNTVKSSWISDMDYLCGRNVQSMDLDINESGVIFQQGRWNISKDMITENKLAHPRYQPRKFVYENKNSFIKESINEFKKDYDINPEDNIEHFYKYYVDLYEKLNPRLQSSFNEKIKNQKYNLLVIDKSKYNYNDKIELMLLLESLGIDNVETIESWRSNENNQSFVIPIDNYEEEYDPSLDKNYIYRAPTNWTQNNISNNYPGSIPTKPMTARETIDFINKIVVNPVTMYSPRKFIYESTTYYPYRFKTEEEMIRDFGTSWRHSDEIESGWNEDMDHLLGTDYPYQESEVKHNRSQPRLDRFHDDRGRTWGIDWNMLTKNKPKIPNYQPKKFVYENIKKLKDF